MDGKYIIVMKVVDKQLQVFEDPVEVDLNDRYTTIAAVDEKNTESVEFLIHDIAGDCSAKILEVPATENVLEDEIHSAIHEKETAKQEEKVEPVREPSFVFPTFNLNISQECPTPRINDDGDDVIILHSIPPQIEKASIEVKKELYEAWELERGIVPKCQDSSLAELTVVGMNNLKNS